MRYSATFEGNNLIQEDNGQRPTWNATTIESRSDLNGRNLRLCTMPFPVTTMSDDGGRNFYGFSIDIISALAKAMNFTFTYVLPEDGQWGTHDPKTGAWNGMIGMLMNGKCDIW